jgi:hypothetical protein
VRSLPRAQTPNANGAAEDLLPWLLKYQYRVPGLSSRLVRERPGRPSSGAGTSPKCSARRSWTYFYLYVILDVFSRSVAGWAVEAAPLSLCARLSVAVTVGFRCSPAVSTLAQTRIVGQRVSIECCEHPIRSWRCAINSAVDAVHGAIVAKGPANERSSTPALHSWREGR